MKHFFVLLLIVTLAGCTETKQSVIKTDDELTANLKDTLNLNSFIKNPPPLYVLDGVIISNLDSIPPSSIAKIYVLKGEKAIDKYGQKGNHGVIEVISKKTNKP